MARPKKRKLRVRQKAQVRKKGDGDSIKKAPTQMPRDNGLNMRVKIRRKTK